MKGWVEERVLRWEGEVVGWGSMLTEIGVAVVRWVVAASSRLATMRRMFDIVGLL